MTHSCTASGILHLPPRLAQSDLSKLYDFIRLTTSSYSWFLWLWCISYWRRSALIWLKFWRLEYAAKLNYNPFWVFVCSLLVVASKPQSQFFLSCMRLDWSMRGCWLWLHLFFFLAFKFKLLEVKTIQCDWFMVHTSSLGVPLGQAEVRSVSAFGNKDGVNRSRRV